MRSLVHGTDNHVHALGSCMFGHIDPFKGFRLKMRMKIVTWSFNVDWQRSSTTCDGQHPHADCVAGWSNEVAKIVAKAAFPRRPVDSSKACTASSDAAKEPDRVVVAFCCSARANCAPRPRSAKDVTSCVSRRKMTLRLRITWIG